MLRTISKIELEGRSCRAIIIENHPIELCAFVKWNFVYVIGSGAMLSSQFESVSYQLI